MAHRRTGLPGAPPPIDMEKELKTAALYRQTLAELGAARRCPNLTSVDLAALLERVRARTTTPADRRNLAEGYSVIADVRGAKNCPNLTSVDLAALLERVRARTTTLADRRLAEAEAAKARAVAEGLTLQRHSTNKSGFVGVSIDSSCKERPFQARVFRAGKYASLGYFATPEAAALEVARAAADKPKGVGRPPMTAEAAKARAVAEGLTLQRHSTSKSGFVGVRIDSSCKERPFQARVFRAGKYASLGFFATPEAAALEVARAAADKPEGKKHADKPEASHRPSDDTPSPRTSLMAHSRESPVVGLIFSSLKKRSIHKKRASRP